MWNKKLSVKGPQSVWIAASALLLSSLCPQSAQAQWGSSKRAQRGSSNGVQNTEVYSGIDKPGSSWPLKPTNPEIRPPSTNWGSEALKILPEVLKAWPKPQPQQGYGPHTDYVPQYTQPQYYEPQYVPQVQKPLANKVVETPVAVKPNAAPLRMMLSAEQSLIDGLEEQINFQTEGVVHDIQDVMDSKEPPLSDSVNNLGAGKPGGYNDAEKADLLKKAKEGDLDSVTKATEGDNSPDAKAVRDYAAAQQALTKIGESVVNGTLTDKERSDLFGALNRGGFVNPGNTNQLDTDFLQLDINAGLAALVNTAKPGAGAGGALGAVQSSSAR